jgi:tRNA dimethylallyltransferase
MADRSHRPLLAIAGATATGKSDLAVRLAETLDGEAVNADAYALYRGLDIGTAKPTRVMQARVRHHLVDVADPDEPLTLARYLDAAHAALDDIWARGKLPVLAGGSGQYVWALLEGWQVPRVAPDLELRAELEALPVDALHQRLDALDSEAAARLDPNNPRRLVRAIEVVSRTGLPLAACQTRQPIDADVLIIGLRLPREQLYERIDRRAEAQFAAGFVEEVQGLRDAGYGETSPLRSGVGYKEVSAHLDGAYDLDEALRRTKNANHRLVRRQGAWFKDGDERIHWVEASVDPLPKALEMVDPWVQFASRNQQAGTASV